MVGQGYINVHEGQLGRLRVMNMDEQVWFHVSTAQSSLMFM